jgi:hypothetical protein
VQAVGVFEVSFAQTAGATEQLDDFIMGWDKLHKV